MGGRKWKIAPLLSLAASFPRNMGAEAGLLFC